MINTERLLQLAMEYDRGDARRIQHFIKVHDLAKNIGKLEGLSEKELNTLEAAAILHDIGIHACEEKYGNCNGKNQELEGPPVAAAILSEMECDSEQSDRVCYLIGHHHTYGNIDGRDYQILVEADFLVNFYEDGTEKDTIKYTCDKIFRTRAGIGMCKSMYDI